MITICKILEILEGPSISLKFWLKTFGKLVSDLLQVKIWKSASRFKICLINSICVCPPKDEKKVDDYFTHFQLDFFEKNFCVKSLHNLTIIKFFFWKILKIFFFAFTTYGQKLKSAGRISDFDLEKFWNFFWNQETYIFKWSDKLFDIPKSCK